MQEKQIKVEGNEKPNYTFTIVLSAMMIAISVILKLFTPYFPIGGIMVLRLDFYGPFEKLVGVLFGPVLGGITGGIVDFLGFFLANRTTIGFIPQLTLTAILNCVAFALLWRLFRKMNNRLVEVIYVASSVLMLFVGIINAIYYHIVKVGNYYEFLLKFGGNVYFLTIISIIIGSVGLVIYMIVMVLRRGQEDHELAKYFFKLFISLAIPGVIFSIINTKILMMVIPSLADKNFMIFVIPRIVGQMMEILYETYLMSIILIVSRKLFAKHHIDVSVESKGRKNY